MTERIGGYVEAPDCSMALAAGEVVAALAGRPGAGLLGEVAHWVDTRRKGGLFRKRLRVDEDLASRTRQAVAAILSESELKDLWEETDEFEQWKAAVVDLQKRVG